jgi:hypothetical protein
MATLLELVFGSASYSHFDLSPVMVPSDPGTWTTIAGEIRDAWRSRHSQQRADRGAPRLVRSYAS